MRKHLINIEPESSTAFGQRKSISEEQSDDQIKSEFITFNKYLFCFSKFRISDTDDIVRYIPPPPSLTQLPQR